MMGKRHSGSALVNTHRFIECGTRELIESNERRGITTEVNPWLNTQYCRPRMRLVCVHMSSYPYETSVTSVHDIKVLE